MFKSVKSFDGTRIVYKIKGKTPPYLLFLHGIGANSGVWGKGFDALSNLGFSVIAPDLRGHGRSGKPNDMNAYIMNNFAKDLGCILANEGIKRVVTIGYSFGGTIAILFYKLFKQKVHSMVLVNTDYRVPFKWYLRTKLFSLKRRLPFMKGHSATTINEKAWHSVVCCISQMKKYQKKFGKQFVDFLSKINVPVLFIESTSDEVVPPKHMEAMCNFIKTAELHRIKGGHHKVWLEKPDEVNHCLFDFFKKHLSIGFGLEQKFAQILIFLLLGLFVGVLSSPDILVSLVGGGITGAAVLNTTKVQWTSFSVPLFLVKVLLSTLLSAVLYGVWKSRNK